jgi:hypothetical protein
MQFIEEEVNADKYKGATFKEVTIRLQRGVKAEDWFDHRRYIREILP